MDTAEWIYNEFKQVGIDFGSVEEVEKYDLENAKSRNLADELSYIASAIDIKDNHKVIEFGTGTGEIAIGLSPKCEKIIAIDVSKTMLHYAQDKAEKRNIKNIEFVHSGFLTYNNSSQKVNSIITQVAFHHLPDFWKMVALQNIYNLLLPGGKICLRDCILSFDIKKYINFISEYIQIVEDKAGHNKSKEVAINIKEEYPTFDWIIESMLIRTGFKIDKIDRHNGYLASFICTK